MKNKLFKALSLCLLLALLAGMAVPGCAAVKPSIVKSTLWAGVGKCALIVQNLPDGAKSFSVTSSNKNIIKAGCDDRNDASTLWIKPLKAGKAKITVRYKAGGKSRSVSATFTVKKLPKPFAWVKVNGRKIDLNKNKLGYDCLKYTKTKITVDFKLNSGWKVQFLDGAKIRGDEYKDFSWKKGKAVSLARDQRAILDIALVNKTTGDEFFYMIFVER